MERKHIALILCLLLITGCSKPAPSGGTAPAPVVVPMEQVPPLPVLSPDGVPIGPTIWTVAGSEFIVFDITGRELLHRSLGVTGSYTDLEWDVSSLWATFKDGENLEVHRIDPSSGYVLLRLKVPGADGLAMTKEGMWVSNTEANRLYLLNPTNGEPLREVELAAPGALAYDGSSLWVVENIFFRILSFDPQLLHAVSNPLPIVTKPVEKPKTEEAKVVKSVPQPGSLPGHLAEIITPGPNIKSLAWSGEFLLAADPDAGKVFFLNPKDGTVVGQLFVRGVSAACWQPALAIARPTLPAN